MRVARTAVARATESATSRARRVWAEMAREACVDARMMGLHGTLPRQLTDAAIGERGTAIPTGLHKTAQAMRESGLSRDEAERRLTERVRYIVALTFSERTEGAA